MPPLQLPLTHYYFVPVHRGHFALAVKGDAFPLLTHSRKKLLTDKAIIYSIGSNIRGDLATAEMRTYS